MSRKNKKYNQREFDEQFEAFLKDSVSSEESINSARISKYLDAPKKDALWWDVDGDQEEPGTSKSFRKKKKDEGSERPSKPDFRKARPDARDPPKPKARKDPKIRVRAESSISKDSLDDISEKSEEERVNYHRPMVHIPDASVDSIDTNELLNGPSSPEKLGMDTLDELADKEKFFRDLERNADGTIDYGRLNQELSATGNTLSPEAAARTAATLAALQDIDSEEEGYPGAGRLTVPTPQEPPSTGRDHSEQKPSMLSKVSLMDSLESTMNTTTSPQVGRGTLTDARDILEERSEEDDGPYAGRYRQSGPETLKTTTATGIMGTNTSQEIEALHKALREVGLSATIGNDSQLELSAQGEKGTADLVQKLLNSGSNKGGKQRNVEEILKELEELQRRDRDVDHHSPARSPKGLERQKNMDEDHRGFNLSPIHPIEGDYSQRGDHSHRDYSQNEGGSHRGGFETSHTEDTEMYQPVTQVSVTERGRQKKKDKTSRKEKKKSSKPKGEKPNTDSMVRRSRSSSPRKTEKLPKQKYTTVKSSGYAQLSPKQPQTQADRNILGYTRTKSGRTLRGSSQSPSQSPRRQTDLDLSPPTKMSKGNRDGNQAWSPADVTKQKVRGTQSPSRARKGGPVMATQLQASVDSFTNYIQDHFSTRPARVPEVQYSQDEPSVSTSFKDKPTGTENQQEVIAKFKAELAAMERSTERQLEGQRMEYEQEIAALKQELFVLKAKLSGSDENDIKKKIIAGGKLEGVTKEQMEQLEREMKEQETLISGYQQENKRVYNEMKNIQKKHKQTEERMFNENQKLLSEASSLRTQLERKEDQYRNKGAITGPDVQRQIAAGNNASAVASLGTELEKSKRIADGLNREMAGMQSSRTELEKHVERLVIEKEELKKTIEAAKTMKSEEAQALEVKYMEEVDKLNKKLHWYAENQELLEKGSKQIRRRDDEILKLKLRIEELQTESGKRVEDSKVRVRERAADAKKIQDLQRQVKEMEQILKRRNPNALPTLMMAAAAATSNSAPPDRSAYTEVLEKRVAKLEGELERKDGDTDTLIRGVEQKYNAIKLQYEERIKDLELQLSIYQGQTDHVHPHTHAVALERELESVRERYKQQVHDLQAEVDRLTTDVSAGRKHVDASVKSELSTAKATEAELRALVKSLQVEVESKGHDLQVMQKSLERLRKEKQISLTNGDGRRGKLKGQKKDGTSDVDPEFLSLPAQPAANEKQYEPKAFADTHISDVLKENEDLKMKLDHLQLQHGQQRVDLQKSVAESEAVMRRCHEEYDDNMAALRASHQKDVQQILAQHAFQHSTSRLADLQSKVDTQEVMIKHLREQQARLEVEAEAAAVLRIKQTRLEEAIKSVHRELQEARQSHSPEMRHFEALQEKIVQIENKHGQREQELQQIIRNTRQSTNIEVQREVEKWKKIVETKNTEIQKFRMELDSILQVLQVLQKQGVLIPVGSTGVS